MLLFRSSRFVSLLGLAFVAIAGLTLGACDSMLDKQPQGSLSNESFWETEKDLTTGANAIYQPMIAGHYQYTYNVFGILDGFTPIGNFRNGTIRAIKLGTHAPTNGAVGSRWAVSYEGIVRANDLLTHVGEMDVGDTLKNQRKGEALFMRAWYYFNLVYFYGDVPLITGVPTLEDVTSVTRAPKEEVVTQMLADLDEAIALLPSSWGQKGRATQGAALTLKAKVLMQEHRYAEAVPVLERIMQMDYALFPNYDGLFATENEHNSEVIWTLEHTAGTSENQGSIFDKLFSSRQTGPTGIGGWSWFQPTLDMVKTYEKVGPEGPEPVGIEQTPPSDSVLAVDASLFVNRDPRMYYTVLYPGVTFTDYNGNLVQYPDALGSGYVHTDTGMHLRKFITLRENDFNNWDSPQDWIFFRYADVLLLYAEAKLETGQVDASVYEAINTVRGRPTVEMPPIEEGKTAAELREIIRRERTVELAFEGWHYFDMKRWETLAEAVSGDEVTKVSTGIVQYTAQFETPRHLLWPIPQSELDRNPNLKQNPGWN